MDNVTKEINQAIELISKLEKSSDEALIIKSLLISIRKKVEVLLDNLERATQGYPDIRLWSSSPVVRDRCRIETKRDRKFKRVPVLGAER